MIGDLDGPSAAELDAIEAEWPAIEAELALLDAELVVLLEGPSEIGWRRVLRALAEVTAVRGTAGHGEAVAA